MKIRFAALAAVVLGLAVPQAWGEARVGSPAPDFSAAASDGKTYHLKDFTGKYLVLEWTNKDCPFVHKHYDSGNMQKLQETYLHKGVAWLSVASSAPGKEGYMAREEMTKYRVSHKVQSIATLLDPSGKMGKAYGAKTTPHIFIIDPKGVVIYTGAIDDHNNTDPAEITISTNYVQQALDAALSGQPVPIPSTPPYGCSVKYKS
jgi:peroxiredoxin